MKTVDEYYKTTITIKDSDPGTFFLASLLLGDYENELGAMKDKGLIQDFNINHEKVTVEKVEATDL